ncbi:MAG: Twin-arginine translocation protein TatB [Myxococcaceae bacterium]|nr:Twin-arginine translocation protein TatB [Myxococcaceae bacterium]
MHVLLFAVRTMFGLSFGELVVLVIVAVVVIGPRDLPKMLRKLGQWAGKLRRMAAEMRAQSGIDDVLKADGLGEDIAEIRKLARGEIDNVRAGATLGSLSALTSSSNDYGHGVAPLSHDANAGNGHDGHDDHAHGSHGYGHAPEYDEVDMAIARDREYPREGADSYNALPDTAIVYDDGLPASEIASDPLYANGEQAQTDAGVT